MTSIRRPRLPLDQDVSSPTFNSFPLERRLRRGDPSVRIMTDAVRFVRGHVKRTFDQFQAADSLTGLENRAPPRYGVALAGTPGTVVAHAVAGDGYISDLDTTTPFFVCRARWGGTQDPNLILRRVIAKLHPANGGAKNVDKWRCELWIAVEVNTTDIPGQLTLSRIAEPVDVTAGPSEADVTFDFQNQDLRPIAYGPPDGNAGETAPLLYIFIKALKTDNSEASNVGWRRDSTSGSITQNGVTIQARQLDLEQNNYYSDASSGAHGTPIITLDAQTSMVESTIAFTGAGNQIDLGAVPAAAADVVFVVEGERPVGTKITAEARVGGADPWVEVKNRQSAADVGLAASRTYQAQARLTPTAAGDATPILTDLGAQELQRTDFSHVAHVTGGGWGFDPVTLKSMIAEVTITAIQQGERRFRDAVTDVFATTYPGDLWFRVSVGADDLARHLWYHLDDFYPDHQEGKGGALVIRAVSLLGMLQTDHAALPKFDPVLDKREALAYANHTLKDAWDDLLRNQLGLSEDRIGAEVEAAGALDILTKTIKDSNVKTELDAVAFRAGGAAQSFQGKIAFADVHGARGVDAVFGIEDIIQETVTPGYSQAVPVFYGDYDYDLSTGTFRKQHRGFNALAISTLGTRAFDAVAYLDDEVAKGIPAGPGGSEAQYVEPLVKRQIETLGTGMITVRFRSIRAHPELWPGNRVAVRVDRFVGRNPLNGAAIRGYVWLTGVISRRHDLWGTDFSVWVLRYSDIVGSAEAVTIDPDLLPSFTGASYTTEAGPGGGAIAAYNYRNTAQFLPDGLWRTALYDDGTFKLQKNTAVAGDFSSLSDYLTVSAAGLVALLAGLTVSGGEVKATEGFRSEAAAPSYVWRETDQTLPLGLWRARVQGNTFLIERNTAAGGDFSSLTTPFQINASDQATLSGLLTLSAGLTVSGGSISASGIAATVGALTATSGAFSLTAQSVSPNYPAIGAVRTSVETNNVRSALRVQHRTTGDMVDGFGAGLLFEIRDDAAADNAIAGLVAKRSGADTSGYLAIVRNSTQTETARFTSGGEFLLGTPTPATGSPRLDVVGVQQLALANVTTNATLKVGTLSVRHYTNIEEPIAAVRGLSSATQNYVMYGGLDTAATYNAATIHQWYTAANQTTLGGTLAADLTGVGPTAHLNVRGDVTIGSLGRFDGADTPLDLQLLVYHAGATLRWQAESFQLLYSAGDTKVQVQSDGTTVAYLLDDPGTGADSPVGAPPTPTGSPVLTQTHKAMTVDLSAIVAAYSPPADFRYWEVRVSTDNFVASDDQLCLMTGSKAVHGRLDTTTPQTYYYRVRAVDRAGNTSGFSSTASAVAVANDQVSAFGAIIASEISVTSLAAINANIGIITAGQLRNAGNVAGINLGGAGGVPGGWVMGINMEAGATVTGMLRYLDFAATGAGYFLKTERLHFGVDGVVRMYPTTSAQPVFGLSGSDFWLQNNAATPTQGINIYGTVPASWTRYLNLNGSGAMLLHDKLALNYDGSAIFRGVAQETDTNPKFKIDFPNKLLTVIDEQATPVTRIELGKFGAGASYGLKLYGDNGDLLVQLLGTDQFFYVDTLRIAQTVSATQWILAQGDGLGFIEASTVRGDFAWGNNYVEWRSGAGGAKIRLDEGADEVVFTGGLRGISATEPLSIYGYSSPTWKLQVRSASISLSDGSTNEANVATIVVSASAASGDYPQRTIWCRV